MEMQTCLEKMCANRKPGYSSVRMRNADGTDIFNEKLPLDGYVWTTQFDPQYKRLPQQMPSVQMPAAVAIATPEAATEGDCCAYVTGGSLTKNCEEFREEYTSARRRASRRSSWYLTGLQDTGPPRARKKERGERPLAEVRAARAEADVDVQEAAIPVDQSTALESKIVHRSSCGARLAPERTNWMGPSQTGNHSGNSDATNTEGDGVSDSPRRDACRSCMMKCCTCARQNASLCEVPWVSPPGRPGQQARTPRHSYEAYRAMNLTKAV
eukprot:gnl/TRDRNA2_/TRDRNA2_129811_c0_seq2.p1 gnl/TRDRNA2_/TRDRNA2_129811_c0~~gnl/TRDRNA2_/TRDRNA2_129811_c0_seq2.p1  ORF type:complete len:269 (-),score=22.88 gnl/TRDRNA2_/TRDRNA2_129811_c0_seq2:120-926(-)